ncbi:lamin tail domain-containing protein [Candidatus Kaiserbacteria bacterium]|nr:lamin tail domain-containing protein [Candidatus Kaiserbacteria bacterium]
MAVHIKTGAIKKTPRKKEKATVAARVSVPVRRVARRKARRVASSAHVLDLRPRAACAPRAARANRRKSVLSPFFIRATPRLSLKALAVTLMIGLNSVGITGLGSTRGYYNDIESSTENAFRAGSVDFSLTTSGWQATSTAVSMPPGDVTKKTVAIDPQASNPFQYFATSTNFTGDADFCSGLDVTATRGGTQMYHGPLTGLLTATTTALDPWEFAYTAGTSNLQNRTCDFDIDYNGWQTRHDYPSYEGGGFNDTEKVKNHLASWGFRINKIYYNVKTPERGAEGTNEWVEIYNQTNVPLDISGWQICDNTSCDTLPTTLLIPAQKYAVIVATSTTATSTTVSSGLPAYWYLPSEVTEINIHSKIGGGLDNDADMLVLKRPDRIIVDQMNWGTPDTGWTNYNPNVWDPGAANVAEGNVLARVPSGYDTDAPSDWKELVPPSIDLVYPDEGGSYTWYWTHSYEIKWTATNNNGPDGDLDIGIYYVKDVNHDGKISLGDTTHTIVETTGNDGAFTWTVPSGFLGYIWIHLVAIGPENPMLNSGSVSGRIYDPFPLFIGPENVVAPLPVEEGASEETEIVASETTISTEGTSQETAPAETAAPDQPAAVEPAVTREEDILSPEPEAAVETPVEPAIPEPAVAPAEPAAVVAESAPAVVESAPTEATPAE